MERNRPSFFSSLLFLCAPSLSPRSLSLGKSSLLSELLNTYFPRSICMTINQLKGLLGFSLLILPSDYVCIVGVQELRCESWGQDNNRCCTCCTRLYDVCRFAPETVTLVYGRKMTDGVSYSHQTQRDVKRGQPDSLV